MSATTAAAAAAAIQLSIQPNSNQPNQDLASLFECPVCFDYVLPPILQVSFTLWILSKNSNRNKRLRSLFWPLLVLQK